MSIQWCDVGGHLLEPELWWTSTYKAEDGMTLKVRSTGKRWDMLFAKEFDLLGNGFRRKRPRTLKKDGKLVAGWHISCARSVSLRTKCDRIVQSRLQHCFDWDCVFCPWS